MQVKVSPLNPDPKNEGQFVESQNVSFPQLAEGKMRIRVAFLPMNEQQHAMIAELLPKSAARIVQMCADGLITIERQDHPALPPKVHMIGSPLWMDIEIGPMQQPEEPGIEPAVEPAKPAYVPTVGDYVQWESSGELKFAEPKQIIKVVPAFAFFEGNKTGVPLQELIKAEPPKKDDSPTA